MQYWYINNCLHLAATEGVDYEILSPLVSTLTFGPSVRSFDISFLIFNDSLFETPETFEVDISIPPSPPAMLSLGITGLVVTIVDDEGNQSLVLDAGTKRSTPPLQWGLQ